MRLPFGAITKILMKIDPYYHAASSDGNNNNNNNLIYIAPACRMTSEALEM